MPPSERRSFVQGMWTTGLGTLASRILGLARDMATAALLGLGESGVMDALVVAVRIPNLFRRLFGEGALTASFLPVFTAERERSEEAGWKLASIVLVWLTLVLTVIVLVAELLLAIGWLAWHDSPAVTRLIGLNAATLPYVVTICCASLLGATLQALGHFSIPALAPTLLNICWLIGALVIAPWFAPNKLTQAYVIVACIQVAGVLQAVIHWPALRAAGFRFNYDWLASREAALRIARAIAAVAFGLTITQINTMLDGFLAWFLAAEPGGSATIAWLGNVQRPLSTGAAAAIYYGERFYQLPLGILGLAIATAIFPLLSRHAARGDHRQLGVDLTMSLRVALFTSVPAGIGLVLLAEPLARLVYQHGVFTSEDALRTSRMIAAYCAGVWAYCAAPVVVRGFYAVGDQRTPVRIGLAAMVLNLLLDLTLVWWVGEVGLAASTTLAAIVQLVLLLAIFHRRFGSLAWNELGRSVIRTLLASAAMTIAVLIVLWRWPTMPTTLLELLRVGTTIGTGLAVYALTSLALQSPEWKLLFRRDST
jgi:putative peptidoglycan lipid II flippase